MSEDSQQLILINGVERDTISIHDRGLNYGDGIFETIAIYNGKPLLWDLHWKRLINSCQKLYLEVPVQNVIEKELETLSRKISKGVVKIILTRGAGNRGYKPTPGQENTRIIIASPRKKNHRNSEIAEIIIGDYVVYPEPRLAGIKHLNRLPQVLASIDQANGDRMAVLCDDQQNIVEAISSNIFIVNDGVLQTPDLTSYGVEGVMREHVLLQAKNLGIKTEILKLHQSCLQKAEEIFLTNSIIGILPVTGFNSKLPGEYGLNSIAGKLMTAINQEKYYN